MKKMRHQPSFIFTIGALLIFCILMIGVMQEAAWIHSFDHVIATMVRNQATPSLTRITVQFTQLFNLPEEAMMTVGIMVILIFTHHLRGVWFIGINSILLAGIGNRLIKGIVNRPRPTVEHLVHVSSTSFPSGHAMSAMLIGGSLIILGNHLLNRSGSRLAAALVISLVLVLVGLSRIYVGVHFPSDVVSGWALGFVLLTISNHIFNRFFGGTI